MPPSVLPEAPLLPSLQDAFLGAVDLNALNEAMARHTLAVWRAHFHGGLVRMLDDIPELEGFDLRRTDTGLIHFVTPILPESEHTARKRCDQALLQLRRGMPKNAHDLSQVLGDVQAALQGNRSYPLENRAPFRLDRSNTEAYLTHMLGPEGPALSAWHAAHRLNQAIVDRPTPETPKGQRQRL